MSQNEESEIPSLFIDEFCDIPVNTDFIKKKEQPILVLRDLDSLPAHIKTLTIHRLAYIVWTQKNISGGWTKTNLVPLLEKAKVELGEPIPKWRALARWWSRYKKSGYKVTALIPQHKRKGNRKPRFEHLEEEFAQKAMATYLNEKRPSIASVYEDYKSEIIVQNEFISDLNTPIKTISYTGFYKRIKKLPNYALTLARKGKYAADLDFMYVGTHKPPTRVLERVEIDHTPIPLIVLDDNLLIPIGRACLTLLIDAYSHCIFGFNLGFHEPGFYPVRNALLNAFKPKASVQKLNPDIIHDWPCHGKPETIIVDNAVEFWGDDLEQTCNELTVNVQYNPVRKPWLKPFVERFFQTINTKVIDNLPGKTFANMLERYEYDPVKDAIFRFSEFVKLFVEWIVDDYHFSPDSRKRFIPILLWQKGFAEYPPKQYTEEEQHELDVIISIADRRLHNKGGIRIHSLRYDSEELANYRRMYDEKQLKTKVLVKTNPNDVSYIHVFIEKAEKYLKVPCVDAIGYTQGLSLQQHRINLKLQHEYINRSTDIVALAKVRQKLKERIQHEVEEITNSGKKHKLKYTSRLAKFQGVSSQQNSTIAASDFSGILSSQNQDENKNISDKKENIDDWESFISNLDPY